MKKISIIFFICIIICVTASVLLIKSDNILTVLKFNTNIAKNIKITIEFEEMNGNTSNTKVFTDKKSTKVVLNIIENLKQIDLTQKAAGGLLISVKIVDIETVRHFYFAPLDYVIEIDMQNEKAINYYSTPKGTYDILYKMISVRE